ncbi:MAG: hypothetical protein OQL19_01670 [Gammaproteobacteria bacterium]|nr:hypothetical protein [Gammaproteobacteria bacterium]
MMKKFFYNINILFCIAILSACQSTLIQSENNYFEISNQASIEITQVLEVAPNSARVFFQNGEVISHGQLNLYDINCEIEINTVSDSRQIIEPGVFDIISVAQNQSPIVKQELKKQQILVASLNYVWNSSNSPVDIKRYYHFKLSAQDPRSNSEVRAMTCRGAQDTPFNAKLPTYEEMRKAGGQYIKLNF